MKKHDEGYALVLVLVVMVVLCLVATSVLAIALNNLKKQEASVARMQAKYEAQAKIEEFYANLQYDMLERATVLPVLGPEGENVRYFISNDDVEYINRNGIVEIAALVQPEADADNKILGSGIYIAVEAFGEDGGDLAGAQIVGKFVCRAAFITGRIKFFRLFQTGLCYIQIS